MGVGAPGAAPEGPKIGLFSKISNFEKKLKIWGVGRSHMAQTGFEG